jgi:hypothetical protein
MFLVNDRVILVLIANCLIDVLAQFFAILEGFLFNNNHGLFCFFG